MVPVILRVEYLEVMIVIARTFQDAVEGYEYMVQSAAVKLVQ